MNVGLEGLGILLLELVELSSPSQRTNDVDVDVVLAPLGGSCAGKAADALLGCSVGALTSVAEEAGAGAEIDNRALGLLQIRIAGAHVKEGGIEARKDAKVKILAGVLSEGHARGGSLCVIDKNVDAAESLDGLVYNLLHASLGLGAGVDICLNRKHLHAVKTLELLLGLVELLYIAASDDNVGTLLGVGNRDAVADGAAAAVR